MLLALAIGFLGTLYLNAEAPGHQASLSPEQIIARIGSARNSNEAGKLYEALTDALGPRELADLMSHRDNSIALMAAWELYGNPQRAARFTPERFVGFIEGRTGLRIPARWDLELLRQSRGIRGYATLRRLLEENESRYQPFLRRSQTTRQGKVYEDFVIIDPERLKSLYGMSISNDMCVKKWQDFVILSKGMATCRIRQELLIKHFGVPRSPEAWVYRGCDVYIGASRSYIALHEDSGGRTFPLICVDSPSGTLEWQADVWAAGAEHVPGLGGRSNMVPTIVLGKGTVAVFGGADGACYLETFDAANGGAQLRFATNNWFCR
jgi:hypothetical protein